jgi:hypothetical protein
MKIKKIIPKNKIFIIFLTLLFLSQIFIPSINVWAATQNDLLVLFGKENYTTYYTIDELMSRIINVSNKHQLKYFNILAKWETYSVSDQEQLQDVQGFIDMITQDYQFISDYTNTEIGKKFKNRYKQYQEDLKKLTTDFNMFYDERVIFFNYAMDSQELGAWYDYYVLFKENTLKPFANKYIYNNNVRISVKKVREENKEEKKEGIEELNKLISTLKSYRDAKDTPNIIKGYCSEMIKHYTNIINGKKSDLSKLIRADRYWVEGLIQVGQEFDKLSEYNFYVMKFNKFADFPTIELAKKLKAKELNNFITMLQTVPATSKEIIQLKKKHYDLIYSISNYKNKNELSKKVEETYPEFFKYYNYLSTYFSAIQKKYGIGFSSSNIIKEIDAYKDKLSCLDSQADEFYTNVKYSPIYVEDTTEYRNLAIKDNKNWSKVFLYSLIGIFAFIVCMIVYKAIGNKKESNDYDDYYDNYY